MSPVDQLIRAAINAATWRIIRAQPVAFAVVALIIALVVGSYR